ncbi:MAG: hypothetical protein RL722_2997 [Pseudomonadota bacterium]
MSVPDSAVGLPSGSFHGPPRSRARAWHQAGLALAVVLAIALGAWAAYAASERAGLRALRSETNHRLDLFAAVVESRVRRLEALPATIQLHGEVLAALRAPADAGRVAAASDHLRRLNAHLGSLAVFVLDERGVVLASSNRDRPDDSRPGSDMGHRPYFLDALAGRVGRHFALGAGSGEPGYFVSHPIRDGARVVGVATIKISLAPIEQVWELLGAPALLADAQQIVILSSQPEWRYTALAELPLERRVDLQINQLYGSLRIPRFPLPVQLALDEESQLVEGLLPAGLGPLPAAASAGGLVPTAAGRQGAGTLVLGRTLDGMDWRVLLFADLRGVSREAARNGLLAGVAVAFVMLLLLVLRQRQRLQGQKREARRMLERHAAELESKVERRTRGLREVNTRLRKEVAEREQAERTLRSAQDELVHAGKMAVLGQLATGITHELTQPLGAIRTLSGNASEFLRRDDLEAVGGNLALIARLADQMGGIIQPLKSFARKSAARPVATDLGLAIGNALFLYDQRLRKAGIEVRLELPADLPRLWCDPNRLEQVLINLVGNAIDALQDLPAGQPRRLCFEAEVGADTPAGAAQGGPQLRLRVSDSGPGLDEATRARLFEPFFTTKPAGAGLGLGLAISRDIVREFGGEIEGVAGAAHEGAVFLLHLPLAAPQNGGPP